MNTQPGHAPTHTDLDCGGCQGIGSHKRWCPAIVGPKAARLGKLAEEAEQLGDRIGPNNPGAANHCYRAAALLAADAGAAWARGGDHE